MPDDKDTSRIDSLLHDELVMHLAETTDLSPNQARELIKKHGTDRARLEEAARTMKAEG